MKDKNKTKDQLIRELAAIRQRVAGLEESETEREGDAERLHEIEEMFRLFMKYSPVYVFFKDEHIRAKQLSENYERMLGRPVSELLGKTMEDLFPSELARSMTQDDLRILGEGKPIEVVEELNGRCYTTTKFPIIREGKPPLLAGFTIDITERKQTEEALRENEEQYRSLFDTSTNAILIRNREDRITMANGAAIALLGATKVEDLIGKAYLDFVYPEDRPLSAERVEQIFQMALEQHRPRKGDTKVILPREHRMVKLNGDRIHVESTAVAFYHKGSLFIQGIFRDITERKRVEEGLRESEAEARRLAQENAVMAAIGRIISSTFKIEDVYERFAEEVRKLIPSDSIAINIIHDLENTITVPYVSGISVPGYQPGDVVPLAGSVTGEVMRTRSGLMIQAVARDELQARFPTLLASWDAGLRSLIVVPLISRDRVIGAIHFRSVRANAYSDQDRRLAESIASQIAGAVANAKLFAERKRAEEEIKKTLSLLNATLESTTDGLLVVDRDGKIERCNQKFIQMWRIPESVIAAGDDNRALTLVLGQLKNPDGFLAGVRELYSQPTAESYDVIEFKDGRIFERYSQPQRIGEAIAGRVWSFRDVTERKRIEKERERLEERLRRAEKMEALGTLAGGVAHDLNNVLGVLVGYSELLLMEIPEGDPLRTHASNILQSGQRTAAIVQDLLTLARRGVAASEVVSLNHVIFNYFNSPEFEKLKAYHPMVTFKDDLDKDLLNVKGSPVHLNKTIMNLLSNAAEAISDRGEVTVRTENRYLDKPIAGYEDIKEGGYVVLSVSDNGKGISREDLGKIFEPFYTKKVMGRSGTGLGLAVVWGTMKDHGGYIDVRSEEGKGSTFILYIPVTREGVVSDREAVRAESYMGRGESILVVDDVKEQRELATTMLSKLGYRVRAASSGEEALTVLQTNRVDLLVLDMIMAHGIDGLETYQRALEINPRQKAIIVSGFSETDRVKTAQVLGAGTYVRKPYVLEKIGLAIRKELDK